MAGLNKVMVIGNLGRDPEARALPSGDAVVNFSVATTRTWKDKEGSKQEETEWHRIVAFGKLADICSQYLHKGSKVYCEGRLKTRKWEKDGVDMYSTEIVLEQMQMLDTKGGGDSDSSSGDRPQSAPKASKPAGKSSVADLDDDIPF